MPTDTIQTKKNLRQDWNTIEKAIALARRERQDGSEVWCVVSFDGVYMGTVWSQARTPGGPTNHAEDRFFGEYSLNMISDFIEQFGKFPSVLRLTIKYSPCNKSNDNRESRCTFRIAHDNQFWLSIQVRYEKPYTNPFHDMKGSEKIFEDQGISSSRIIFKK
jgi:hypothetical protein